MPCQNQSTAESRYALQDAIETEVIEDGQQERDHHAVADVLHLLHERQRGEEPELEGADGVAEQREDEEQRADQRRVPHDLAIAPGRLQAAPR